MGTESVKPVLAQPQRLVSLRQEGFRNSHLTDAWQFLGKSEGCIHACLRAFVRAFVRACVRACKRLCISAGFKKGCLGWRKTCN